MATNGEKWGRMFLVSDTARYKRGFTIYKIISMLYPESCPDAITKITVWKRYNDFKKLHRSMKSLHKNLHLKGTVPNLPNAPFFKRFDNTIIQQRKQIILEFLEFVASHRELFTSKEFVKFFKTSYVPNDQSDGNINAIRAKLEVPTDPEYSFMSQTSEDEQTISDTDSMSTVSGSLSVTMQISDLLLDPLSRTPKTEDAAGSSWKLSKTNSMESLGSSTKTESVHIYPTPPTTPGSLEIDGPLDYVMEASRHINAAVSFEIGKKFEDAFAAYKTGIDILLRHVRDESDLDRRTMVRHKTEKYLLRAEKIYNVHLSPEMKSIHELVKDEEKVFVERPASDLYKYKVVKVIGSGMLVEHSELQQRFFVKVVQKNASYAKDDLILPENVPYMVRLQNYYDSENAIFLVLDYCSGSRLWDYVNQPSTHKPEPRTTPPHSDNESEHSYTDLILSYRANKNKLADEPNPEIKSDTEVPFLPQNDDTVFNEEDGLEDEAIALEYPEKRQTFSSQRSTSERSFFDESEFAERVTIDAETVIRWSAQLVMALEKLHRLGVVCCDLHSRNLLVDENQDLVLTYTCNVNGFCDKLVNSCAEYRAPESFGCDPLTKGVDWWSYGAILYELLVGMPLKKIHPGGLHNYTSLKIPKYVSPEGRSLLTQLLTCEPRERLGCGKNGVEDLKLHPFFASVSWDALVTC